MPPARPDRRAVSPFAFAVLGMEMAGFTVAGVVIDLLAGSLPWATVVLTLLGMVAAFLHMTRLVKPGPPPGGEVP